MSICLSTFQDSEDVAIGLLPYKYLSLKSESLHTKNISYKLVQLLGMTATREWQTMPEIT